MTVSFRDLLRQAPPAGPSPDLAPRIMQRVNQKQRAKLWIRFLLASAAFVISFAYAMLNRNVLGNELAGSSFIEFLRFAWSDPDIVLSNIGGFTSGLLETLPLQTFLVSLIACCTALFALRFGDGLRHVRRLPHLTHSLEV